MSSLDSLPPDSRAVLQLLLQRGLSYDEIARLLSIDPAVVRSRAVAACEAVVPGFPLPAGQRAAIVDLLVGGLNGQGRSEVEARLSWRGPERDWAQALREELAPEATSSLPELPAVTRRPRGTAAPSADAGTAPRTPRSGPQLPGRRLPRWAGPRSAGPRSAGPRSAGPRWAGPHWAGPQTRLASGLALLVTVVVVALVVILLSSGGGGHHSSSASARSSSAGGAGAPTVNGGKYPVRVLARFRLQPPDRTSKAVGLAEVIEQRNQKGLVIVGQNVPPNSKGNAYAIWLYNAPGQAQRLGWVSQGVTANGRLVTAGGVSADASHYKYLLITRETNRNPKTPGTTVLQGALAGL